MPWLCVCQRGAQKEADKGQESAQSNLEPQDNRKLIALKLKLTCTNNFVYSAYTWNTRKYTILKINSKSRPYTTQ